MKTQFLSGNEYMEFKFTGHTFYRYLKSVVPVNNDVIRKPGTKDKSKMVDFIFTVAADDFNTYMEVNEPSTGLVQEKAEYTNIENGVGLFSSRFQKTVIGNSFSTRSLDSLFTGQYTYKLGFCSTDFTSPYFCGFN